MCNCRVTDDLNAHLEAEKSMAQQIHNEMWEEQRKVLDVKSCDVCQGSWPGTEFEYEGICIECATSGTIQSDGYFKSEDGEIYAL